MAHMDLYLCNPYQASVSYPFSSIDISINADAEADADAYASCGQGLRQGLKSWRWLFRIVVEMTYSLLPFEIIIVFWIFEAWITQLLSSVISAMLQIYSTPNLTLRMTKKTQP